MRTISVALLDAVAPELAGVDLPFIAGGQSVPGKTAADTGASAAVRLHAPESLTDRVGLRLETVRAFFGVVTSTLLVDGCFGHALCALCVLVALIVCATFSAAGLFSIFHLEYLSALLVPITGPALHLPQQEAEDTRVMPTRDAVSAGQRASRKTVKIANAGTPDRREQSGYKLTVCGGADIIRPLITGDVSRHRCRLSRVSTGCSRRRFAASAFR